MNQRHFSAHGMIQVNEEVMYRKGTFVRFLSNWPAVHLNEMFGHNDLARKDIGKSEQIGVIIEVNDFMGPWYRIFTVRPLAGFTCKVCNDNILQIVKEEELTKEELRWKCMVKEEKK